MDNETVNFGMIVEMMELFSIKTICMSFTSRYKCAFWPPSHKPYNCANKWVTMCTIVRPL